MAMPIERKNSFHLLLSDDELSLLRLLAERDGLNPSDYLRTTLRRLAGTPPQIAALVRMGAALGALDLTALAEGRTPAKKQKGK